MPKKVGTAVAALTQSDMEPAAALPMKNRRAVSESTTYSEAIFFGDDRDLLGAAAPVETQPAPPTANNKAHINALAAAIP